jgi:macrolide transport system ATP-binding/permease protein
MLQSIEHPLRVLRKDPVFTAVAICSLALGICVTSSMFSFADEMLLRPLPVRNPDRVVTINTAAFAPFGSTPPISYPDYADLRDIATARSTAWWPLPTRFSASARTTL